MILVDLNDDQIKEMTDDVIAISANIGLENDLLISPIIKDTKQFQYWLPNLPFYQNVIKEGIVVYG